MYRVFLFSYNSRRLNI